MSGSLKPWDQRALALMPYVALGAVLVGGLFIKHTEGEMRLAIVRGFVTFIGTGIVAAAAIFYAHCRQEKALKADAEGKRVERSHERALKWEEALRKQYADWRAIGKRLTDALLANRMAKIDSDIDRMTAKAMDETPLFMAPHTGQEVPPAGTVSYAFTAGANPMPSFPLDWSTALGVELPPVDNDALDKILAELESQTQLLLLHETDKAFRSDVEWCGNLLKIARGKPTDKPRLEAQTRVRDLVAVLFADAIKRYEGTQGGYTPTWTAIAERYQAHIIQRRIDAWGEQQQDSN